MNNTGVTKRKDMTAGNSGKLPVQLPPDSNASKIAYAKSLIDTSDSLIRRSMAEKVPVGQSNQQAASIIREYNRVFKELTPIGKAEVTRYRVQKVKELADFKDSMHLRQPG
jgi:hypothetical protein